MKPGSFYTLVYFFIIGTSICSIAQTNIALSGKVFDASTREPLGFASISIAGKPAGTVTNAVGEFDFNLPEQYSHDTLVISHIGYKSFRKNIADLSRGSLSIGLNTNPLLLNEVVIREEKLTGKEIVAEAVKNLTINYSTQPYCLKGFFREIEQENEKYVVLTEAAVDVYDKNFDGKSQQSLQEAVAVREMRRSLHYGSRKNKDNIGIALTDLLENNDVRYNRGMLRMSNTFSMDTITTYHDRLVYGISIMNETDSGMLYIDTESYGILKIIMERRSRTKGNRYYQVITRKGNHIGRVWFRFTVEFEPYENKLYLRRTHESELNEIYDKATGQVKISSMETLEFVTHNIVLNEEDKNAEQLKYGMNIKTGDYHPDFWKNYNSLKLTPLDEKLLGDLEKETTLKEQFENQNKIK